MDFDLDGTSKQNYRIPNRVIGLNIFFSYRAASLRKQQHRDHHIYSAVKEREINGKYCRECMESAVITVLLLPQRTVVLDLQIEN